MSLQWKKHTPQRPDRYLDWGLLARPAAHNLQQQWSSVVIQVPQGSDAETLANLEALYRLVRDASKATDPFIKMHSDEVAALKDRIKAARAKGYRPEVSDDPGLTFFAYMRPTDIYEKGLFKRHTAFSIRYAGPVIEGLKFNKSTVLPVDRGAGGPRAKDIVAMGIIDDGIGFAHERFRSRKPTGGGPDRTRVKHIWLQATETANADNSIAFGTKLSAETIDDVLSKHTDAAGVIDDRAVYRQLGLADFMTTSRKSLHFRRTHGTHVLDLAAGFDARDEDGQKRPIFAVQLPDAATIDTSGITMGSYVLQGLRQIMLWADQHEEGPLPLVINFSYGFYAGPKDGTHVLEREIDRMIAFRRRSTATAVVLPAGNALRHRTTAVATVPAGGSITLDWVVLPDGATPSFLEVWTDVADAVVVTLTPPDITAGPPSPVKVAGEAAALWNDASAVAAIFADGPSNDLGTSRTRWFLAVSATRTIEPQYPPAPAGPWKITLENRTNADVVVELHVQRNDAVLDGGRRSRQSYLDHETAHQRDDATGDYTGLTGTLGPSPITQLHTLSALATGAETIIAGAVTSDDVATDYSSSGPTLTRAGPDASAVADESVVFPGVFAAGTLSGTYVPMRGTSVAAPQVAREIANLKVDIGNIPRRNPQNPGSDPAKGISTVAEVVNPEIPSRRRRD